MERRYVTVDVFADRPFGGNPLAVVLDAGGLSTAQMQAVAGEFNYSETTFVLPPSDPRHTAQVRIFTPRSEVPFAGHPNVGTAFALARAAAGRQLGRDLVFEEAAGLVSVRLIEEAGAIVGAELTAPETLSRRDETDTAAVAACLGVDPSAIRIAVHRPLVVSVGLPFLVAELASRAELRAARPVADAHARLLPPLGVDALYVYTRDAETPGCAIQARMFAPLDGIAEDPATGSATAALAALLATLGRSDLSLEVAQGVEMGRPSRLSARVETRDGRTSVRVGGRCVPVMQGQFHLVGDVSA